VRDSVDPDTLLESVVSRIMSAGDTLTETRETLLSQVRGCIADCRGTLAECAAECQRQIEDRIAGIRSARDESLSEAELLTRGNVAALESELLSLGGESGILAGGNGDDTPPGGSGCEYQTDLCRREDIPPVCPLIFQEYAYYDRDDCRWKFRTIDFTRYYPEHIFGNPGRYAYEDANRQVHWVDIPPTQYWHRGIVRLMPITITCRHGGFTDCQYTIQFSGQTRSGGGPSGTRPSSGIALPPGGQPPPPPPRPPIEPPGGQPPGQPPTVPPPPGGETCEAADPCYPHVPRVVQQYVRRVPPLPVTYYARVRCLDGCTADVECWEAWCPPDDGSGWIIVGPYQVCPDEVAIDRIIRYYCRLGGREPPGGTPIGGQPPGEPPVNPPPPPEPPPREEQCKVQMLHPPRWEALTPVCMDEARYLEPLYGGIDSYDDVGEHFGDVVSDWPEIPAEGRTPERVSP
jgi:hypothetical protein